jgi:hypothetical protein
MAGWIDKMIADGLRRTEDLFAEEQQLGQQLWSVGGWRCYGRPPSGGSSLTIRRPGKVLTYEIVGVDLGVLT